MFVSYSFFFFVLWPESKETDVLTAFHAEQKIYLEKKKASQKRKGEGRDEQVDNGFCHVMRSV